MLLWVLLAVLTAGAITYTLRPLIAKDPTIKEAAKADIAVYKDQLTEINSDLDRGLINADEAEAARAELARRLLKRADAADREAGRRDVSVGTADAARGARSGREWAAMAAAAVVPIAALVTYISVGSPGLPARPYAERIAAPSEKSSVDELVAKVEERLRQNPEDGRGWDVVAPVYMRLQRYDDAVNAFASAIRLSGETPRRVAGLAQAEVAARNGLVSARAKSAYERLLELDPKNVDAMFWLGQAAEQEGNRSDALSRYGRLLEIAPKDAEWRPSIEKRVAALQGTVPGANGADATEPAHQTESGEGVRDDKPARGPTREDVAAANQMTPGERQAFISSMVDQLAERLNENGNDAGGWKRLIQAYMVLGRKDDAAKALQTAREIFAKNDALRKDIEATAERVGL